MKSGIGTTEMSDLPLSRHEGLPAALQNFFLNVPAGARLLPPSWRSIHVHDVADDETTYSHIFHIFTLSPGQRPHELRDER